MNPITPEELQFLYDLLLDNTQATVRQAVTAHEIMKRIALQLAPQQEKPNDGNSSKA